MTISRAEVRRSLLAARRRATEAIAEALRPSGTLARVGNSKGVISVPGHPGNIYCQLLDQPRSVVTAQTGAAPPKPIDETLGWTIEVKRVRDAPYARYRIVNWLLDSLGRPVSDAAEYPVSQHPIAFGPGTLHSGTLDGIYTPTTTLASPTGAAGIGIEDAGGHLDAEDVETALQEIMSEGSALAYRYAFSDAQIVLFTHPYANRPGVIVHFSTPLGFGLQPFGTSRFGIDETWTQEGGTAPAIVSITFPSATQVRVELDEAASGEVLCIG
jgi:hypothetical protein